MSHCRRRAAASFDIVKLRKAMGRIEAGYPVGAEIDAQGGWFEFKDDGCTFGLGSTDGASNGDRQ